MSDPQTSAHLDVRRSSVTDLGAAIRRVLIATAVTDVPVARLDEATALASRLAELLEESARPVATVSPVDDLDNGIRFQNPVSGEGNGMAPPLRFEVEAGVTVARTSLDAQYEGPPGFVHGGFTAMMFDEVVGRALEVEGRVGMTASLSVTYHRPVPTGEPIELRSWIERSEGRKTWTRGTVAAVAHPDVVLAEAEGLFIEPRQEKLAQYFGDLVGGDGRPVSASAWGEIARDWS